MKRILLLTCLLQGIFLTVSPAVFAQSTLFSENFEGFVNWQTSGPTNPNAWIVDGCAGNGATLPGTKSAYISSGGAVSGCGPTGSSHYGYANAASGSNAVVFYRNVNNTCFSALQASFDIQIGGTAGQDYAELVYSTNSGASWTPVSGQLTGMASWQAQSFALPASLNNTSFWLGFRFIYDNAGISGSPAAIDNVKLEGTTADATPPSITCPATFNIYANTSCMAVVPDLPPSVTKSDNCSAASDLLVNQTPAIGSLVSGSTTANLTFTDQAGNSSGCSVSLIFIDTVSPQVICPPSYTTGTNSSCQHVLGNYIGGASGTDNCTTSGSLTFSQSPNPGINLMTGVYDITISATDASGNTGSCQFTLTVADTTDPIITCPAYHVVTANALCDGHVGDLSTVATASDNCSVAALLSFSQVPAATTVFSDTIQATIYVSDAAGNIASCVLNLVAADTVAPVVTCLSDTTVFTTNPCNYFIPNLSSAYAATDACSPTNSLTFSQSPANGTMVSGLTTVTTIITDEYGNQGYCYTTVHATDAINPTITCPGTQSVSNGTNCSYTLVDYTSLATVTDNCPDYFVTQSPAAGTIVNAGSNTITLTVTDAGMHQVSCTFQLSVIETQQPAIACPANITSCDSVVTYAAPMGMDNCLFVISQTDASGLSSGSVFPEGITTQTYMIADSSGNTASCSFTIEVLEIPDNAVINGDTIVLCNTFTSPIAANAVSSGTGSWSVLLGSGIVANASANNTSVSNLSVGTNKLIWSVSSPSCGTKRDTLVIIVWPLPSVAHVQDTLATCSATGVFLQGSVPTNGIGTWSNNSGISFNDIHAPVTGISNLSGGTHIVIWTITSGTCPSSSDTMILVTPNQAQIFQSDTSLCIDALPMQLMGSIPGFDQNVVWSTLSGEAAFSTNYAHQTVLEETSIGTVEIIYWLTHPVCGNSTDTLVLNVTDCEGLITNIPTLFTPNDDTRNDVFEIPHLGLNYPGCRVEIYNRWGGLMFESDGYANPWDGTYKGEPAPMGTYFYHIRLNDAKDTQIDGSISIIR